MSVEPFYAPVETYIGRVRLYGTETPRDSRVMTEKELRTREQFTRIFGVISFDEDTYDAMFRFIMKNLEHCDKLQPITLKDLK
jgi:hypothetical protein